MFEFYFTADTSADKPINGKFRHTRDDPELFTVILNILLIFKGGGTYIKNRGNKKSSNHMYHVRISAKTDVCSIKRLVCVCGFERYR